MAIERISIENFTVFDKIEIEFCDGVNIFIGENGTGKTTLIREAYNRIKTIIYHRNLPNVAGKMIFDDGINSFQTDNITITLDIKENLQAVYIPTKDTLSMSNITRVNDRYSRELNIEQPLIEIIKIAQNLVPDEPSELAIKIAPILEDIIDGTVFVKESDLTFWVRKRSGLEVPFSAEAEGFRKLGLLWQLLMNESITKDTILFWDEPEANLHPKLIPVLVDLLLEISREGVQIFLATHEYRLARYFDLKKENQEEVVFHNLYRKNDDKMIHYEYSHKYKDLKNNDIEDADEDFGDFVIKKAIEELDNL